MSAEKMLLELVEQNRDREGEMATAAFTLMNDVCNLFVKTKAGRVGHGEIGGTRMISYIFGTKFTARLTVTPLSLVVAVDSVQIQPAIMYDKESRSYVPYEPHKTPEMQHLTDAASCVVYAIDYAMKAVRRHEIQGIAKNS